MAWITPRFRGKLAFLSNFHDAPVRAGGMLFPTVEHAFQALKTLDMMQREEIRAAATPGLAKKLGKTVTQRPDWDAKKVEFMARLLHAKFTLHQDLATMLIATDPADIVEVNGWHDNFWGTCACGSCPPGLDTLGRLLREVRAMLIADFIR